MKNLLSEMLLVSRFRDAAYAIFPVFTSCSSDFHQTVFGSAHHQPGLSKNIYKNECYHYLIISLVCRSLNIHRMIFNTFLHVSIAVVDLLQELTDIDTLHESEEGAEVIIDALVSAVIFRSLYR